MGEHETNPDLLPRLVGDFKLTEKLESHTDSRDPVFKCLRQRGTDSTKCEPFAIRETKLDSDGVDIEELQREVVDVQLLHHENLMPMLRSFVQGNSLYTIMPFMEFGSVYHIVEHKFPVGLPELGVALVLRDVLQALAYLHSQRCIHRVWDRPHRSVRCSHVLIERTSDGGRCRLSGLRHCVRLLETARGREPVHRLSGTLRRDLMWLAPEVLRQDMNGYGTVSDVYSAGIAMCEMTNGFPPFADMQPMQMLYEKMRGTTPKLLDSSTLPTDEQHEPALVQRSFSAAMHSVADIALRSDPAERWGAEQLLTQHAFFKNLRKSKHTLMSVLNL